MSAQSGTRGWATSLAVVALLFAAGPNAIQLFADSIEVTTLHNQLGSCSTDELFHSVLVECSQSKCTNVVEKNDAVNICSFPSNTKQIVHVQSTRAGLRLACSQLPNLDYAESGFERSLNINTTVHLKTREEDRKLSAKDIVGFGATLDTDLLFQSIAQDSFKRTNELILKDLFHPAYQTGANLNILRLVVQPKHIAPKSQYNLTHLLVELDRHLTGAFSRESIKVVLDFRDLSSKNVDDLYDQVGLITTSIDQLLTLKLWAVSVDHYDMDLVKLSNYIHLLLGADCHLFATASVDSAPATLRQILKQSPKLPRGILLKAVQSTPYNLLDYLTQTYPDLLVLTLDSGQRATEDFGDWQNGKNFATEMMNHLKFGAAGFIEDRSVNEVLTNSLRDLDTSIYSLQSTSHHVHFKGPIYYALTHYSGFMSPASKPTRVIQSMDVFTQPNMFAAHYQAFRSRDGDIIVQVLNDNEHLLPFRLALNEKIIVHIMMEPKSMNTLLLKDNHVD